MDVVGVDEELVGEKEPGENAGHGGSVGDAGQTGADEETCGEGYDGVPPNAASEHQDEHTYSADGGDDKGNGEEPFGALTVAVVVLKG